MKNTSIKISIRIILLFVLAILISFIPEQFPRFFGDEICNGSHINLETGQMEYFYHYGSRHYDVENHWGYQQWLFFTMGLSLSAIQIKDIIELLIED